MRIGKPVTEILNKIAPTCIPFIKQNGTLTVQLLRALYGCKQSGKLWKDRLSQFLVSLGFKKILKMSVGTILTEMIRN